MTKFEVESAFAKFVQVYIAYQQAVSCLDELPEEEADALAVTLARWASEVARESIEALHGWVVLAEGVGTDDMVVYPCRVDTALMYAGRSRLIHPAGELAIWNKVAAGPVMASTSSPHWLLLAALSEQTMASVREFLGHAKAVDMRINGN